MKKDIIERFGGLQKEEPLSCIEDELLLPESCVLESVSPFAGYYTQPNASKPLYLYLMLEGNATFWPVMEAIQQVKKTAPFDFDAVFGEISFTDQTHCYTVRVRDLAALPSHSRAAAIALKTKELVFSKKKQKSLYRFLVLYVWRSSSICRNWETAFILTGSRTIICILLSTPHWHGSSLKS